MRIRRLVRDWIAPGHGLVGMDKYGITFIYSDDMTTCYPAVNYYKPRNRKYRMIKRKWGKSYGLMRYGLVKAPVMEENL